MENKQFKPFTYTVAQFMLGEISNSPVDESRIPVYLDQAEARAAGHGQWDLFRTPDGKLHAVGPAPIVEESVSLEEDVRLVAA